MDFPSSPAHLSLYAQKRWALAVIAWRYEDIKAVTTDDHCSPPKLQCAIVCTYTVILQLKQPVIVLKFLNLWSLMLLHVTPEPTTKWQTAVGLQDWRHNCLDWPNLIGQLSAAMKTYNNVWVWVNTYRYIFSGMNIHLPAILGFTRYQGFDPSLYDKYMTHQALISDFRTWGDLKGSGSGCSGCSIRRTSLPTGPADSVIHDFAPKKHDMVSNCQ